MAATQATVSDHRTANAYLGRKDDRPLPSGHHTRLQRRPDGAIAVRLHATDVVTYLPNGTYRLDSGGWRTVTTKARIAEYAPVHIGQKAGVWTLYACPGWMPQWANAYPYADGIVVDSEGMPVSGMPSARTVAASARTTARMTARIRAYVRGYMAAFRAGMPLPGLGDCLYCQMDANGPSGDTGHLISHMTERYYVPSLAVNALVTRGYPYPAIQLGISADGTTMGGPNRYHPIETNGIPDSVSRAITRYLKSALLPDVAR